MTPGVRRSVLRLMGRAYEAWTPPCLPAEFCAGQHSAPDALSASTLTRWEMTDLALKAGWYMLEVVHSLARLGCVMRLKTERDRPEHLLLTSKAACKRIIRFDADTRRVMVSIDQPGCTLKRFALVGLSQRFVLSRMRSRLENRGRTQLNPGMEASALYEMYRGQIDESLFPSSYRPVSWSDDTSSLQRCAPEHLLQNTRLVVHPAADEQLSTLDKSVRTAMDFARQRGWDIVWDEVPMLSFDNDCTKPDKQVFHLPVLSGIVYRADAFHQLLSCLDEHSVLVYADHDHLDAKGGYFDPVLKPAWNPELLLNADYIRLPWIISDFWVRRLTGHSLMTDLDADQLLLAASLGVDDIPPLTNEQVKRVPMVLASVRAVQLNAHKHKSLVTPAWHEKVRKALHDAEKAAAVTQAGVAGICRVVWTPPEPAPMVDIVIPTRDKVQVLRACVDSVLQKTRYVNYRLLIVDNDSKEGATQAYYDELRADSRVKLLHYAGEFNYSAINNHAVAISEAPLVVLLNNDTEVISPGWLDEMVGQAMRNDIGCVGAKLYYSNGRIQHGGVVVGINGVAGHAHRYCTGDARGYCDRLVSTQNLAAVTAACLAIRRSTYLQVGGLDQTHLGVAWNDVDLCLKVQSLGFRNLWTPYAELFHHEGLSRGADDTPAKMMRVDAEREIMINRWKLDSFEDPAYHPLLTRESEQFSLGQKISQPG